MPGTNVLKTVKSLMLIAAITTIAACSAQPEVSNGPSGQQTSLDMRALVEITR